MREKFLWSHVSYIIYLFIYDICMIYAFICVGYMYDICIYVYLYLPVYVDIYIYIYIYIYVLM